MRLKGEQRIGEKLSSHSTKYLWFYKCIDPPGATKSCLVPNIHTKVIATFSWIDMEIWRTKFFLLLFALALLWVTRKCVQHNTNKCINYYLPFLRKIPRMLPFPPNLRHKLLGRFFRFSNLLALAGWLLHSYLQRLNRWIDLFENSFGRDRPRDLAEC